MKKFIKRALFASLALAVLLIAVSCGAPQKKKHDRLTVVATMFPLYDWARNIAGENADVLLLLDNSTDLHSYQPTVDDIVKIASCDLFLYVGGESDKWVADALTSIGSGAPEAVSLLKALGDKAVGEELLEGMEAEQEHEHEEDEGHEEEEEIEYDEHVWLSLRNAKALCGVIADTFGALDSANAGAYAANLAAYTARLDALDEAFESAVSAASGKVLVFADRYPFRYLADDYGLTCYAAFSGCSAETEASFETVVFLAHKVDEYHLPAILQIESADGSLARTVRDSTADKDQAILTLDSLQSATGGDERSYLAAMETNLDVLKQALR